MFHRLSKKKSSLDHGMVPPKFGMSKPVNARRPLPVMHTQLQFSPFQMGSLSQEVKTKRSECGSVVNSRRNLKLTKTSFVASLKFQTFRASPLALTMRSSSSGLWMASSSSRIRVTHLSSSVLTASQRVRSSQPLMTVQSKSGAQMAHVSKPFNFQRQSGQ